MQHSKRTVWEVARVRGQEEYYLKTSFSSWQVDKRISWFVITFARFNICSQSNKLHEHRDSVFTHLVNKMPVPTTYVWPGLYLPLQTHLSHSLCFLFSSHHPFTSLSLWVHRCSGPSHMLSFLSQIHAPQPQSSLPWLLLLLQISA